MFYGPNEAEVIADDMLHPNDQVGLHWPYFHCREKRLSGFYFERNKQRRPLIVMLPGRTLFCIDSKTWKDSVYTSGWEVTGEAPNMSVKPSINAHGVYHGYLTNGVLSDDVEGRIYGERGHLIQIPKFD
jgi:hypothetical protein